MTIADAPIHRITTIHGQARRGARPLASCPRRHEAVELAQCFVCPYLRAIESSPTDEHFLCATERDEPVGESVPGTVGALMTRDVLCVRPEVTIESAAIVLRDRNVSALPVVDEEGRPIGIVSNADVVRAFTRSRDDHFDSLDPAIARTAPARTVQDMMSREPVIVHERDPLPAVARQLERRRAASAAVVSSDGRVVGVVAPIDVLRLLGAAPSSLED